MIRLTSSPSSPSSPGSPGSPWIGWVIEATLGRHNIWKTRTMDHDIACVNKFGFPGPKFMQHSFGNTSTLFSGRETELYVGFLLCFIVYRMSR